MTENHAYNAANEIVKRMEDDGVLEELTNYDQTVAWVANIIAKEYGTPLIGFLDKSEVDPTTLLDAILEFGEGDNEPEHLREY